MYIYICIRAAVGERFGAAARALSLELGLKTTK